MLDPVTMLFVVAACSGIFGSFYTMLKARKLASLMENPAKIEGYLTNFGKKLAENDDLKAQIGDFLIDLTFSVLDSPELQQRLNVMTKGLSHSAVQGAMPKFRTNDLIGLGLMMLLKRFGGIDLTQQNAPQEQPAFPIQP